MYLTLEEAERMVAAALAKARSKGGNSMSVAVVDGGGYLLMLARMDDANALTAQIAEAKAAGCAQWRKEGDTLARIHAERPVIFQQIDRMARLPLIPSGGSLLIRRGDRVIGAIGISGAPDGDDNEVARAALAVLGQPATLGG